MFVRHLRRQLSRVLVILFIPLNTLTMSARYCFLLGLLLAASAPIVAQNRFSFGVTAAPVLNHVSSRFSVPLPDQNGQLYREVFDNRSTTGGYFVGVPIRYNLTPKWSVSSGFWFNQFRSTGIYPFSISGPSARIISSSYQVPLTVDYRPSTRRLSAYFSVGAVGSYALSTVYKPEDGTGLEEIKVNFVRQKVMVQALLGAGVAYRINQQWSLTAQPQLIWYFKPRGNFERYVSYRLNGQVQLLYSF